MRTRLLALSLLLSALPPAAQAGVILRGPTEPVEVGDLCEIFVGGIEHEALPQAVLKWWPRENVQVRPAMTWAGEPFILFRSKVPGEVFFWVAILRDGKVDYSEIVIDVGGSILDPPDPLDLAEYVQRLTGKVQSTSHDDVAEVFQGLAAEIAEGKFRGSSQILNATSAGIFGDGHTKRREWIDWFNTLAEHLLTDLRLVSNSQWSDAYQIIATVLEGARE